MNNKKPNAALVWKHLDDFLVPRLALGVIDRAVYSYLLRHSRLEGKPRVRFSITWLARGVRISQGAARPSVRRLLDRGALRLLSRSKAGHHVQVLLPQEIRAVFPPGTAVGERRVFATATRGGLLLDGYRSQPPAMEAIDFLQNKLLRESIHSRERGFCFYCLRRLTAGVQCLDHVVPQVRSGGNSYRNLVSCCLECNSHKGAIPAADFLRRLYRDRRLTTPELTARLRALDALASGKLRPTLATPANPTPRKGRPPLAVT
jgi:5-methylcytosine-specific restriction endonuclease McrA